MEMCTTLYRTKPFSIVLKPTNGKVYDPVSYSNFQYCTKTDQWKCVRPCIVQKHSVSYWDGPMGICTTLYRTKKDQWEYVCTTLYRTKTFSIVLKRTNGNVYDPVSYKLFSIVLKGTNGNLYDPVSYSNVQYRTKTDQ